MILCMETVYFGLILIYRYSEHNGWLLELDGRFSGSIMEYWKHTHKSEGQNMKNGKFGSNRRHQVLISAHHRRKIPFGALGADFSALGAEPRPDLRISCFSTIFKHKHSPNEIIINPSRFPLPKDEFWSSKPQSNHQSCNSSSRLKIKSRT